MTMATAEDNKRFVHLEECVVIEESSEEKKLEFGIICIFKIHRILFSHSLIFFLACFDESFNFVIMSQFLKF